MVICPILKGQNSVEVLTKLEIKSYRAPRSLFSAQLTMYLLQPITEVIFYPSRILFIYFFLIKSIETMEIEISIEIEKINLSKYG